MSDRAGATASVRPVAPADRPSGSLTAERGHTSDAKLERRLQLSAALVMLGLVVELVSLRWHHPTAFVLFVLVGGLAMAAGILLFSYSIVSRGG